MKPAEIPSNLEYPSTIISTLISVQQKILTNIFLFNLQNYKNGLHILLRSRLLLPTHVLLGYL
jgi:hypothetical protein